MFGLVVNYFIRTSEYKDVDVDRAKVLRMDFVNMLPSMNVQSIAPLALRSKAIAMDIDLDAKASPTKTLRVQILLGNFV